MLMLDRRRHSSGDAMFTPEQLLNMTANEVAEATVQAAAAIRKTKSTTFVYNIVKRVDAVAKGVPSSTRDWQHRNQLLHSVIIDLYGVGSVHAVRRHLVPAVNYSINHASFISDRRKSKVLAQWKDVVGQLDRETA